MAHAELLLLTMVPMPTRSDLDFLRQKMVLIGHKRRDEMLVRRGAPRRGQRVEAAGRAKRNLGCDSGRIACASAKQVRSGDQSKNR